MKNTLRIAHCSDIHLDAREAVAGYHRDAFSVALAEMRKHRPDLMLLAGDLFESNRASAETIAWAMETLGEQPFPIIMIPGNHDCLEPDGIYLRHDFNSIANVTMLGSQTGSMAHLPALRVSVWGKGMVEHSPANNPLDGCPPRPAQCRWYLALAHGILVPHGSKTDRSSPIHMCELEASDCDYIALGHHHAAQEIATARGVAVFAGSPTDKIGRGATYAIADLAIDRAPIVHIHVVELSPDTGARAAAAKVDSLGNSLI
jgi:DNA repair exonuclease SbcCD nuclease subunit